MGSRGHPASPGRGAGPLGWFQAVGQVSCCNVLPFAAPKVGQVDLPLPQLVLAHLNSLKSQREGEIKERNSTFKFRDETFINVQIMNNTNMF